MERKILHGNITPNDIAQALTAEFNQGNLIAQVHGKSDNIVVQIGTHPNTASGGQTALTVTIQKVEDGIMIQIGEQAWLGIAASLGQTAFSLLRNPFNLLGRLDDLAQDIQSLQLQESVWRIIDQTSNAFGASRELSERLSRITCEYCGTANPVGEGSCIACGAALGSAQPATCKNCGFVVSANETVCPNCGKDLPDHT